MITMSWHELMPHVRRSLAGVVALSGVWYMVVAPSHREVRSLKAQVESAKALVCEDAAAGHDEPLLVMDQLGTRMDRLYAWANASGEPSKLYEEYRRLAQKAGVRVDRIDPGSPASFKGQAGTEFRGESFVCSVDITGEFPRIVKFIESCSKELGSARVSSFRLAGGTTDQNLVAASVETTHLRMERPAVQANAEDAR